MKRFLYFILLISLLFVSCNEQLTNDPSQTIVFSEDTIFFDTVFTTHGSATRRVVLRNPNPKAVMIHSVRLRDGNNFILNFDGEQNLSLIKDISLAGGDSLYLFIRADIDPTLQDAPLFIEDKILVEVGDHTGQLVLQAYGWDITILQEHTIRQNTTFSATKPYLIRGYLLIQDGVTLTLPAGCHIYLHDTAQIACYGGLISHGSLEQPVRIQSDRLDDIFEDIPYLYVGGRWDGIYLVEPDTASFDYTEILSGNIGIYLIGSNKERLTITNSRIHNHNLYGVVVQDADALIANSEISNCAGYCLYLSGGTHEIIHTTIASYFNNTRYAVQTTTRVDSISPLYINNLSKRHHTELRLLNSIVAGAQHNCIAIATPLPQYYTAELAYSYLQTDTLPSSIAHHNTYPHPYNYSTRGANRDTIFVHSYYSDRNEYYDFRLDSLSPARDIADSLTALRFPLDRLGNDRFADGKPDAGCYERR